jgi:hypothetical protein
MGWGLKTLEGTRISCPGALDGLGVWVSRSGLVRAVHRHFGRIGEQFFYVGDGARPLQPEVDGPEIGARVMRSRALSETAMFRISSTNSSPSVLPSALP